MNEAQFKFLFDKTVEDLRVLGGVKGGEYAKDQDRLHNFTNNAEQLGLSPYDVWAVYAGKHWDAIRNWIIDERTNTTRTRSEPIEGRVKDLIMYGFLLLAIIQERRPLLPASASSSKDEIMGLIWEDHK